MVAYRFRNAARTFWGFTMSDLQISLFWRGPTGQDLLGQLMSEVRGIPALLHNDWPAYDYHGFMFGDQFWSRALYYLNMVRPWLQEHGAHDFLIQINGMNIEEYLERQIKADTDLRTRVSEAVRKLKGSRFSIPNPHLKRIREELEAAIS